MQTQALEDFIELIKGLTAQQRLEAYIGAAMIREGETGASVAKRHRITRYYVTASITGKRPMRSRVQKALEADLEIDLRSFLIDIEG